MHNAFAIALASLLVLSACDRSPPPPGASRGSEPTEEEKTFYVLGQSLAAGVQRLHPSSREYSFVERGLQDAVLGKAPAFEVGNFGQRMEKLATQRAQSAAASEKKKSEPLLTRAEAEPGAQKLRSGL